MKRATIESNKRSATQESTAGNASDGAQRRGVGPLVVLFRVATTLGLVTTLALAAVAGMFTTGDIEMLKWHSTYATVLAGTVLVQLLLSVLMWRVSRGLWRLIVVALLVVVMTVVQTAAGDSRTLSVHMPLGMAICAAEALLMYWAYGLRASWRTPARTTGESGDAPGTGKEEA